LSFNFSLTFHLIVLSSNVSLNFLCNFHSLFLFLFLSLYYSLNFSLTFFFLFLSIIFLKKSQKLHIKDDKFPTKKHKKSSSIKKLYYANDRPNYIIFSRALTNCWIFLLLHFVHHIHEISVDMLNRNQVYSASSFSINLFIDKLIWTFVNYSIFYLSSFAILIKKYPVELIRF
jgi:hypothetical protein